MSDEHFTVDGTLIQAWASKKSFRKKDGSDGDGTSFHASTRSIRRFAFRVAKAVHDATATEVG